MNSMIKATKKGNEVSVEVSSISMPTRLVNLNFGIIKIMLEISREPVGQRLGVINLPGNIQGWYLNIEISVFFQKILYGHWDIV